MVGWWYCIKEHIKRFNLSWDNAVLEKWRRKIKEHPANTGLLGTWCGYA